ncbi:divalent-cation tolerance protein CutA [Luteolibacter ambystomatis]|uniref:Divalent-cation tolerance protein CutA n=1 Tax=Luteolibacter ambystomatis TaxID=2824561 RepID=A0A975G7Y0_9BACT|nr:divalent-cation tolerance protein CutA [Luteolibacter ambystomatis]QUE49945.1 divalent-cation tolerance protein CutA [Luteolibacter ambystomatis]
MSEALELLIVLCTFPDPEQARQIGTALVETQLAACVNLLPGVESIYRWQGQIETSAEVLAVFKTTRGAFPAFEEALTDLHPYEVPEILALEPADASAAYAAWVWENASGARNQ